jgi:hypothetical protein
MDEDTKQKDFRIILTEVMRSYKNNIHDYLEENSGKNLTDSDVIILIMNLTINISTNIYYSLKSFLPKSSIDFDFLRAKMINELSDSFEKIKSYQPEDQLMQLDTNDIKEIMEKGFTTITLEDGSKRKIYKEDLLFKKDEIDQLEKEKDFKYANTPKIIN